MTVDPRGKHRIFDPDETTTLPAIPAGPSRPAGPGDAPTAIFSPPPPRGVPKPVPADTPTVIIPAVPPDPPTTSASVPPLEAQHTTVLPAVRDAAPTEEQKAPRRRWNEKIVPLRAKRTEDGYLSVHSELTRTTTGTVMRGTVRGLGELLITLGLIVLLFAAYEIWGTTAEINAQQNDMARQLEEQWNRGGGTDPTVGPGGVSPSGAPVGPPAAGEAKGIAIMHLPKLDKRWVVVEGVAPKDIRRNPGHYPGTAMPGQQGNFSIAGHRNRGTFWDLDRVLPGDKIVVEIDKTWYVYEVTQQRIVAPAAVEVVRAVPPGEKAGKLLTLTTCNPKLDNYQRLIVHAKLIRTQAKTAGRPAELGG